MNTWSYCGDLLGFSELSKLTYISLVQFINNTGVRAQKTEKQACVALCRINNEVHSRGRSALSWQIMSRLSHNPTKCHLLNVHVCICDYDKDV